MALYDLRFDNFDLAYMKRWVHELSRMKINQLMLFLSGDYRARPTSPISTDGSRRHGLASGMATPRRTSIARCGSHGV